MSAKQSRPSNTSAGSEPPGTAQSKRRNYQTCADSKLRRPAMFIPKKGSPIRPFASRSSSKLPGTWQGSASSPLLWKSAMERIAIARSLHANDQGPSSARVWREGNSGGEDLEPGSADFMGLARIGTGFAGIEGAPLRNRRGAHHCGRPRRWQPGCSRARRPGRVCAEHAVDGAGRGPPIDKAGQDHGAAVRLDDVAPAHVMGPVPGLHEHMGKDPGDQVARLVLVEYHG